MQHKKARLIYGKVNVSLSWCGHQHPPIRQPASGAGTPSSRHNLGRVMTNEATQLSKIISYVPDIIKWHLSTYNNFICWRYNNLKSNNLILLRKYVVIQNNIKITIVVQDKVWDNLAQMWKNPNLCNINFPFRSIQNDIWVLMSTSAACTAMFIILVVNLTHQLMMINTLFHHLFSLMKPF